jgi:hypothetical protein
MARVEAAVGIPGPRAGSVADQYRVRVPEIGHAIFSLSLRERPE